MNRLRLLKLEDRLAPALATWDGGGATNLWSTPENWVGDVAPNPGALLDDLVFPAGAAQLANVNDYLPNTAFNSLSITGGGYSITGNSIRPLGGVTADLAAGETSTLGLAIDGTNGLVKNGAGTLILTAASTYTGQTTINSGFLDTRNGSALGASGVGSETVIFVPDGSLLLNGTFSLPESITVTGAGPFIRRPTIEVVAGEIAYTGALTIAQNTQLTADTNATLTIAGSIGQTPGPGPRGLDLRGFGTIVFAPGSVVTHSAGIGVHSLVLFNGQLSDPITGIGPGFLELPPASGTVSGTGTIGAVNSQSGAVNPGNVGVVGTLTTGDFNFNLSSRAFSVLVIDLDASGADQLNVIGTVTLGAFLRVENPSNFVPSIGTRYRILNNDGTDPIVVRFSNYSEGAIVRQFGDAVLRITYVGGDGNDVELFAVSPASVERFAVGAGAGATPTVNVYDGAGALVRTFNAYDPAFRGGVHVATGEFNNDGIADIVTGPGAGGGPHIRVFDGLTGAVLREFLAYDPAFVGGVNVATADFKSDGTADIITGPGPGGGPHVKVFGGGFGNEMYSFLAYDPSFTGGVSVAGLNAFAGPNLAFVNGVVITGAGPGGGPHVIAREMTNPFADITQFGPFPVVSSFFAYDSSFRGGVNVAAKGTRLSTGEGFLATAPASNGGPDIRFFNLHADRLAQFLAYAPAFTGGVNIGVLITGVNTTILTGAGPGGGPHVQQWLVTGDTAVRQKSFLAFDPAFTGGVFVG